jgi:hypothetical protein
MTEPVRRNRRPLYVLIALFFVPLSIAFFMYYGSGWRPAGQTNHGELLAPVRALPEEAVALRGKWSLVYVGEGRCDEDCRTALIFARQTRLSLNQDMQRVERVFIATGACCDREYLDKDQPGIKLIAIPDAASSATVRAFPEADRSHALFVVDPLGNLVLRYDVRQSPKGLLSDLQKLLKLSHIG